MLLVERHIISKNNSRFKILDELSFLSKNLYNSCLYAVKQEYLKSGKFLRYSELEKIFKETNQIDYRALPVATSQQIMMLFDKNIKSFFSLLKMWKKSKTSLSGCPKFPKYKHKTDGRNIVIFTGQQLFGKNGFISFPKKNGYIQPIKTKVNKDLIQQVRIIHKKQSYVIEVVYNCKENKLKMNNNKASIDLGINNLACLSFNNITNSYILNGKPLKSINQYYNKKKSKLQSKLKNKFSSNKIDKLTNKRNNKVNDYLHKSSKELVNLLIKNDISELVIGYNPEWKKEINLGKKTNQTFCSIPYYKFIEQLKYKCLLQGINVLINEESYTSKCSALDLEPLNRQDIYLGSRVFRGLFKSMNGITINADLNGSLNIGRKVFGDNYINNYLTNRGYEQYPIKINI